MARRGERVVEAAVAELADVYARQAEAARRRSRRGAALGRELERTTRALLEEARVPLRKGLAALAARIDRLDARLDVLSRRSAAARAPRPGRRAAPTRARG